ncbi:hypothetical protein PROPHIGD54-2_91 [Mycobacterium phage prophiGD54-2]|uniref:hypothetical protein n=1 Tax=Mycobacteroides abscessus TaxID=36809 RepID=UPI0019CFC988|nr:hypothetical protein [Mycobacteroides abscessus]QSM04691.1 hypothetical protein PROPHIGD54-2_91 [Mycobacterium phage prophiGD54-2]QSN19615.1 hypothetical protein I3U41_17050 [Mycobacteroides abscessus subsp. abscessus]
MENETIPGKPLRFSKHGHHAVIELLPGLAITVVGTPNGVAGAYLQTDEQRVEFCEQLIRYFQERQIDALEEHFKK